MRPAEGSLVGGTVWKASGRGTGVVSASCKQDAPLALWRGTEHGHGRGLDLGASEKHVIFPLGDLEPGI